MKKNIRLPGCHLSIVGTTEIDLTSDDMAIRALPTNTGSFELGIQNLMIFSSQIRWHRVWMARVLDGT